MKMLPLFFGLMFLASAEVAGAKTILCLGDSLTEGYGLKREEAWPALIEKELKAKEPGTKVINAGVSGATSASGPSRMKWHVKNLKKEPIDTMILALGANDALRGLDPSVAEKNLTATIDQAQDAGIHVILVGMKAPPSLGSDYLKKFESIFPRIAKAKGVTLVPFMLEGVAGNRDLNLADGIHPNAAGHKILAKLLLGYLK